MLALGFNFLIVASNLLLGLSAGAVALQLVLHRLLIVASNRCEGVVVAALEVVDVVEDELPSPPQEARRTVEHAKKRKVISRFIIYCRLLNTVFLNCLRHKSH